MIDATAVRAPARRRVRLLNVDVDDITMKELVETFDEGLLLTVHVDMIMKLQQDREFWEMLPQFDVVTCDSQILVAAARLLGTPLQERVSGSDFFPLYYSRHLHDPAVTMFLCGGAPGVAEVAARNLNAKAGRQMVVGVDAPPFDFDRRPGEVDRMVERIDGSGASVLVVGLGAGRQEKFIVRNRSRLPRVRTFLPLGGTLDYEANTLPRPAPWMTDAGLEWLYRLVREPRKRWRRYLLHQPPALYLLAKQRLGLYRNPFGEEGAA
ncbi:MAG TPA: WecB/TagA/CpsF family glycosyltransferase [Anaeromyxobacter sp.]|nr:WecB/TagA/CpsF family glycosyltransferase [Anaeromyxobacter sp.]HVP61720.1 WecB/TagA/CpsF family glycosyltransferase [Myxococcaceae bacterium]